MIALNARRLFFQFWYCPAFLLILALIWHTPLCAAEMNAEEWEITADRMVRYENPASVIAEGHVILEKKEKQAVAPKDSSSKWDDLLGADSGDLDDENRAAQPVSAVTTTTSIKADWVAYDVAMGQAKIRGNVLINVKGDELAADSGSINLKNSTGSFENARIVRQELDLHLEGRTIEKTGDLTYHIEDGWVITCRLQDGQEPPWSFGAADTKITDGGYAVMKHAVFRVKGIPVFYSPYMILPAKHERQTGFLFPAWYMSDRDGFGLETPFFVNLSPTADITLYPRYFSKRGVMMGGEFRYATDESSKGMFRGHYLDDDLSDPSEEAYYRDGSFSHSNVERYWIRGKADQNFGDWITRLDIDVVSDKDYLREFNSGSTAFNANNRLYYNAFGRSFEQKLDQYRENTAKVLRSFEDGSIFQAEFMAINDVSDRVYSADEPSQFWKLPSLSYSGLRPIASSSADISWDSSYTHFWRDKGVGAQRFDLFPEISTNLPISRYLESSVHGGIRETFYTIDDGGATDWKNDDTVNRWLYRLGGEISTTLYREYGAADNDGDSLGHTIRPFVEYTYLKIPDTDILPQFDTVDEIEEANTIYYGVNNFFSLFGHDSDERDLVFFKARQGYDMRSEMSDTPLTPVELKTGFYPLTNTRLFYTAALDVYGNGTEHAIEADYRSGRGDVFGVDYRYNEKLNINSVSGSIWYLLPYDFALGYSIERAIEQKVTIEEKFHLVYQPACWSVELASDRSPGDQTIMLIFRLANIGMPFGVDVGGAGL